MADEKFLSESELDEIESRAARARPGPWISVVEGRDHFGGDSIIKVCEENLSQDDITIYGATEADHDFVAAARQDVPRLVEEVRRLRK